jgi:hypothetical protein
MTERGIYKTIYADPPWEESGGGKNRARGAATLPAYED